MFNRVILMKLYIFDSCPFCVRSRMLIGLKNIDCSLEYLMADDADTPTRMIGKKNVPVLEKDDGSYLGESWEINRYIDGIDGEPLMGEIPNMPKYETWYESFAKEYDLLCYPRMLKLNMPELNSEGAREYFISSRKKVMGMTLDEAFAKTAQLQPVIESKLNDIAQDVSPDAGSDMNVKFDDFYLFPLLRNLTMVKDLGFPSTLTRYLENLSAATRVPLYLQVAV